MKFKINTIILTLLVALFVADGTNSVLSNSGADFFRVSIFVRFLAQAFFLLLLLKTRRGIRIWLLLLFFYTVFFIGSLAAISGLYAAHEYDLFGNFSIINKMMFFFICYEVFRQYFPTTDSRRRLFRVFEILILTQAAVVIVAFIFDLQIFAAYSEPVDGVVKIYRFGYQGLIPAQNEISAFFIIAFFYFLLKTVYQKQGMLELLGVTVAGLFTGTKVTILLPLVLLFYVAKQILSGKIDKPYLLAGIGFFVLLIVAIWQRDYIQERLAPTLAYYSYQLNQGSAGSSSTTGVIDVLLKVVLNGARQQKAQTLFSDYVSRFNLANHLFGGVDLASLAAEMDPIDLYVRLGLVGTLVFYYFYLKALLSPIRTMGLTRLLFVVLWLGVSLIAGHIAYTAINGAYLAIILLAFTTMEQRAATHSLHEWSQKTLTARDIQPGLVMSD
jgi:hypothetical protein